MRSLGRHGDFDLGDNAATDIEECAPKLAELLDTTIDEWTTTMDKLN